MQCPAAAGAASVLPTAGQHPPLPLWRTRLHVRARPLQRACRRMADAPAPPPINRCLFCCPPPPPPHRSNLFEWAVTVLGPPDTLYEGGFFNAVLKFPKDYPQVGGLGLPQCHPVAVPTVQRAFAPGAAGLLAPPPPPPPPEWKRHAEAGAGEPTPSPLLHPPAVAARDAVHQRDVVRCRRPGAGGCWAAVGLQHRPRSLLMPPHLAAAPRCCTPLLHPTRLPPLPPAPPSPQAPQRVPRRQGLHLHSAPARRGRVQPAGERGGAVEPGAHGARGARVLAARGPGPAASASRGMLARPVQQRAPLWASLARWPDARACPAPACLVGSLPVCLAPCNLPPALPPGGEHSAVGHQHAVQPQRRQPSQRGRGQGVAGQQARCSAAQLWLQRARCQPRQLPGLSAAWLVVPSCQPLTRLHPLPTPHCRVQEAGGADRAQEPGNAVIGAACGRHACRRPCPAAAAALSLAPRSCSALPNPARRCRPVHVSAPAAATLHHLPLPLRCLPCSRPPFPAAPSTANPHLIHSRRLSPHGSRRQPSVIITSMYTLTHILWVAWQAVREDHRAPGSHALEGGQRGRPRRRRQAGRPGASCSRGALGDGLGRCRPCCSSVQRSSSLEAGPSGKLLPAASVSAAPCSHPTACWFR